MAEILFLCHRIPYPPNKGDKIRSWHVLRHLAAAHTVHLGCFVDAEEDWAHREFLRKMCGECRFEPLAPSAFRLHNIFGLALGKSITESHYERKALRQWVEALVASRNIVGVYIFSSAMAQYLSSVIDSRVCRVIDFVDLDSQKWQQYAARRTPPIRWLYDLEARRLSKYERAMAQLSSASVFVTESEAEAFRCSAPESNEKVIIIRNGVDTDYFSPDRAYPNPFSADCPAITFTGVMSYWANQDAAIWFASEVLPVIRAQLRNTEFWIVGAGPNQAVQKLARLPGVKVTGAVPDVRPFLAHASGVVAPMRVGRGVQNKVLEAMAMAKSVVASTIARAGLDAKVSRRELLVATTPAEFASAFTEVLSNPSRADAMGRRARALVVAEYSWRESLRQLNPLFA